MAEARRVVDRHPEFSDSERWLVAVRRLAEAETQENDRQARLRGLLEEAAGLAAQAEADSSQRFRSLLTRARKLAETSDEKLRIADVEKQWAEKLANLMATRQAKFQEVLEAAIDQLNALDQALQRDADLADMEQMLDRAQQALAEVELAATRVGPDARSQVQLARTRYQTLDQLVFHRRRDQELAEAIGRGFPLAAASPEADRLLAQHEKLLRTYMKDSPETERSADFQKALVQKNAWQGILRWMQATHDWTEALPHGADVALVSQRLAACNRIVEQYPETPVADVARRLQAFYRSVVRRVEAADGASKSLRDHLGNLLRGPLMQDVFVLVHKDGRKYYLPKAVNLSDKKVTIVTFYCDFAGRTDTESMRAEAFRSPVAEMAPQVVLVKDKSWELHRLSLDEWDKWLLELAQRVLKDQKTDSFLRYLLLRGILDVAAQGNVFLAETLKGVRSRLEAREIDPAARWMNPLDKRAEKARRQAKEVLLRVSLDELEAAWNEAQKKAASLMVEASRPIHLAGAVLREPSGQWALRARRAVRLDGEGLHVLFSAPNQTRFVWKRVGRMEGKNTNWDDSAESSLCEGLIVFSFRDQTPKPPGQVATSE
ncbi:MAG TPA: hypothetical protein EYP14_10135 [Planctomycetaceae bacterium]|nr:hypothetical protein [Planctomycetaceae bacterium]